MSYSLKELKVIRFLEDLVHNRFTLEGLNQKINAEFGSQIELELRNDEGNDDDTRTDYNLIGLLECEGVFCDVDVFYLPMRFDDFDGANIYVTEVSYEFQ